MLGGGGDATPAVFGREAELADVDALLGSVAAGSGRILLIEGEAGIGKTELARASAARASSRGMAVVRGAADELARDQPGRILGGLAEALGVSLGRRAADTDTPLHDPAYVIVETLIDAVEDLVARQGLVMLVEDVHWADQLSVRGLAAIARRVGPAPLGLVATLRPAPRPTHVHRLLEICHRSDAQTIRLSGLDAAAVDDLAVSLTDATPGPSLRAQLDGAAGNPLFVIELIGALQQEGVLQRTDGHTVDSHGVGFPSSLVQTLIRRLAALPDDTMHLLRLASLLGGEFTLRDLATVAGAPVVEVASRLRGAVETAFIVDADSHLAFRHDLIREAVYLDTTASIRGDLHTAAGHALAAAGAPSLQVARQFAAGARPGDRVAVNWLLTAAGDAVAMDTATAASLYERALDLAPADWDDRGRVEATLVELLAWSGRVQDARSLATTLLGRSLTPSEELQSRRAYAVVLSAVGDLRGAADQLTRAAGLPDAPPNDRDFMRCAAAGMRVISGGATSTARSTVATIADTTDPAVACWAQHTIGIAAVSEGAYDEALDAFLRSRALLDAGYVAPLGFLIPHIWVATGYYQMDRFAQMQSAVTTARHRAERRGDVGLLVQTTATDVALAWVTGRWDDATTQADAALALADETGTHVQAVWFHALLALIALGRGDPSTAEHHLACGEAVVASGTFHLFGVDLLVWARAQLLEARGEPDAARAGLDRLWDEIVNLRGLIQWRDLGPTLVRLCRQAGDIDRAMAIADDMTAIARRSTSPSAAAAALAGRGLAHADPDLLTAAAASLRSTPRIILAAAISTEAGTLLLERGRTEQGRAVLDEAAAAFRRVGADGHLAVVDAVLARAGASRQRARPTIPTFGWEALSPKEREVVGLVAEGLSNPQISDRLVISRRTVESHISHIFRKLGMDNRTQLATEAIRRASTP